MKPPAAASWASSELVQLAGVPLPTTPSAACTGSVLYNIASAAMASPTAARQARTRMGALLAPVRVLPAQRRYQSRRIFQQIERLVDIRPHDVRRQHPLHRQPFFAHHCNPDGGRLEHRGVVGALAD